MCLYPYCFYAMAKRHSYSTRGGGGGYFEGITLDLYVVCVCCKLDKLNLCI